MAEQQTQKKRRGDRKDARLVHGVDPMHVLVCNLLGERADNEAVLNEVIDIEPLEEFIRQKNAAEPAFHYTFFHAICAALAKTIALRPKMNYFIQSGHLYERDAISFAFVVKRQFTDTSDEALALVEVKRDSDVSPLEQIHEKVQEIVCQTREKNAVDGTTDQMDWLSKLPHWLLKFAVWLMYTTEAHGVLPNFLQDVDPYHCTVFISNLGSIRMNANYHHLSNWGTNSFFVTVGEKHMQPFYAEDGNCTVHRALDLGLTIDERIADGVYFSKSVRLLRHLLAHPQLLDEPMSAPVDADLSLS